MFGISFGELMIVGVVALMIVGPHRLPRMLGTLGQWINKLRRLTTEVRYQTGIDELLKSEGLKGGLSELKGLVRPGAIGTLGALASATASPRATPSRAPAPKNPLLATTNTQPFQDIPHDLTREYPEEGADSYGCLPDDLWREPTDDQILNPPPLPKEDAPLRTEPPLDKDAPPQGETATPLSRATDEAPSSPPSVSRDT